MKLLSQGFLAGYIRLVFLVLIKNPDLSWVPIFWHTNENLAIKNQRFSPPLNLLLFSQQNMITSNRFPKDKHMFSVWNVLPKMKQNLQLYQFYINDLHFNPFQRSDAFYIESSYLIWNASQVAVFSMECNTGLQWVK